MDNQHNLPEAFLENMKMLLADEYDTFLNSFSEGRKNALRVNRLKMTADEFEKAAPFPARRVPWTENGFYIDYRDQPGQHPWYRAGVYYLQEPSAMVPAAVLPVSPGDRVLGLCAAPGGKATELGARLGGEGVLVANEISSSRARALERNIELFGIRNCVVSNETPARLLERFPEYFDGVLVDAPCSGEGMFRKDCEAARAWYPDKVRECSEVQKEIILQASDMLRPGGYMVYSTCTFEPDENELVIAHLLTCRDCMELVEIPCGGGRESFARAFSMEELAGKGYDTSGYAHADTRGAVRIWPHRSGGEGHFIALLRKRVGEKHSDRKRAADKRSADGSKNIDISRGDYQLIAQFASKYAPGINIDIDRCVVKDGRVYLMPEDCPDIKGLKFLRAGLYIGDLKKKRFEPSQELAMALEPSRKLAMAFGQEAKPLCEPGNTLCRAALNDDLPADDGVRVYMSSEDKRLQSFLRGETVRLETGGENGWRLVCADRWPVGWGKLINGVLKNHIPAGWRKGA